MSWQFEMGLFWGAPWKRRHLSWTLEDGQRQSEACGVIKWHESKGRPSLGDSDLAERRGGGQGGRKTGSVRRLQESKSKDANICSLLLILLPHTQPSKALWLELH